MAKISVLIRLVKFCVKLPQRIPRHCNAAKISTTTSAEAKRNFFVLAKELHPDTVADPALGELKAMKERLFARINEAAQVLMDDKNETLVVTSKDMHRIEINDKSQFIEIADSSGNAYSGLIVSNGVTSPKARSSCSFVNPMATTRSPDAPRGPHAPY